MICSVRNCVCGSDANVVCCVFRYDEVLFLYGPVGHTHNGIDAKHKTHNQNLGL
jgi:hypothetical protein